MGRSNHKAKRQNPINSKQAAKVVESYPISEDAIKLLRVQQQLVTNAEVTYMALKDAVKQTVLKETGQDIYEGNWILDMDEGKLERA